MAIYSEFFDRYNIDIKSLIPKITESIVKVYGEKHRDVIIERLNNIALIPYVTRFEIASDYNLKKRQKRDMLNIKLLKRLGIEVSKETENEVYKYGYEKLTEEQKEILEFYDIGNFYGSIWGIFSFADKRLESLNRGVKELILEERIRLLQKYGISITLENYEEMEKTEEVQAVMIKIKKVYEIAKECKEEYEMFLEQNKDIEEYIKECEKIYERVSLKYMKQFFQNILQFMSEDEQKKVIELEKAEISLYEYRNRVDPYGIYYIDKEDDPDGIYIQDESGKIYSKDDYYKPIIGYFSEMYEPIIYEDDDSAKKIREKRIQYFKLNGIDDLGNDYKAYEQDERARKIWPTQECVEKIMEQEKRCNEEKYAEIIQRTSNYQTVQKRIQNMELYFDDVFVIELIKINHWYTILNAKSENADSKDKYEKISVIHFPILNRYHIDCRDIFLIHEILHAVEYNTIEQIPDDLEGWVYLKTGFDSLFQKRRNIKQLEQENEIKAKRGLYEYISENIHQRLAILVTKDLHDRGIFLLDDPRDTREKGTMRYERMDDVTQEFFEAFREDIPDAMIDRELQEDFKKKIGEQNFDKLNKVVMDYWNDVEDLMENGNPKLTRKRERLILEAKKIVGEMILHKNEGYKISVQDIANMTNNRELNEKEQANKALEGDFLTNEQYKR